MTGDITGVSLIFCGLFRLLRVVLVKRPLVIANEKLSWCPCLIGEVDRTGGFCWLELTNCTDSGSSWVPGSGWCGTRLNNRSLHPQGLDPVLQDRLRRLRGGLYGGTLFPKP